MTDVDQARAAWYRELAALHGQDAVQFMDSAWPVEYAPGEPLEVMYAREAAHYALLALALEGTDPPRVLLALDRQVDELLRYVQAHDADMAGEVYDELNRLLSDLSNAIDDAKETTCD